MTEVLKTKLTIKSSLHINLYYRLFRNGSNGGKTEFTTAGEIGEEGNIYKQKRYS